VKEEAMRFFATALTGFLALGGIALAEPPKAEPKQPAQQADSQPRPAANIVLASAEPVRGPAETMPAPSKRRVTPRVTSCRCGDPQATPQPDDQ
jgi:hypothetical protein